MNIRHHIYCIFFVAVMLTIILQLNLTRAILFDGYASSQDLMLGRQDRAYYLALVNESAKGNWQLGSPYLKEWSREPYLYPALNIHLAGVIMRALGSDIKSMAMFMDYGAVFLLIILGITLFLIIFKGSAFGYVVAMWFFLFPRLLIWDRTVSPQITFIFLFLFLISYFLWHNDFYSVRKEIIVGVSLGALFYTYPYHWTFALPLVLLTDFWIVLKHRKIVSFCFVKYAVAAVLALPYFFHLWRIYHIPYYAESTQRIGALMSRLPAGFFTQTGIAALVVIFFLLYRYIFSKKGHDPFTLLPVDGLLLGLLTSLVVLNQQVVTGMQLEFNSHYIPVIFIFVIGFVGAIAYAFMRHAPRYAFVIASVGTIVSLYFTYNAIAVQINNNPFQKQEYYLTMGGQEIVNYFRNHSIQNAIVYAPAELGNKIVLLTNNYLYFHGSQELHIIPTAELVDRFTYFDITNQEITNDLFAYQHVLFGHTYQARMEKDNVIEKIRAKLLGKPFVPRTLRAYVLYDFELMRKTRIQTTPQLFDQHLTKYNVDYVIYRASDNSALYRDIPGDVVLENKEYIVKSRNDL